MKEDGLPFWFVLQVNSNADTNGHSGFESRLFVDIAES